MANKPYNFCLKSNTKLYPTQPHMQYRDRKPLKINVTSLTYNWVLKVWLLQAHVLVTSSSNALIIVSYVSHCSYCTVNNRTLCFLDPITTNTVRLHLWIRLANVLHECDHCRAESFRCNLSCNATSLSLFTSPSSHRYRELREGGHTLHFWWPKVTLSCWTFVVAQRHVLLKRIPELKYLICVFHTIFVKRFPGLKPSKIL